MTGLTTAVDQIAVVLVAAVGLSSGVSLAVLIADWLRSRRQPDRPTGADLPPLILPRAVAQCAGEGGAARGGRTPGGAPDTVPTGLPRPVATGLPDDDTQRIKRVPSTEQLPPLVVDSPPGALGTRPTVLDVPVVRLWSCGACRDGRAVVGDRCAWCGTHRRAVTA